MADVTFNQLVEEFIKVNNLLTQIQKKPISITKDMKMSTSMIHLIEMIGNYPYLTITELANYLGVTKGAISQQIPTLKKLKLICITQDENNKKNKLISLTNDGLEIFNAHKNLHQELYDSIQDKLKNFSQENLQMILDILSQISFGIADYQNKLGEKEK